ncbi:hypothetical protein NCS57_00817100 [Fusarium keratoplasticum]|uniref:Uncharacterized protein n=1 Tax=Fusarium keratoplasticum TaxID=1328300 RepID=A0ACC0QUM7_9HYPO|nr:hypothetical protein NCS57_00817100 [Fusarium keratoplasticum]KAI8665941.1 hypothetical protein NCS57_00817100 [Fusarium keratoplasticum]KAI8667654.1 hypothetical protein NCS55_00787700 [Fusarium keratoplasticum]
MAPESSTQTDDAIASSSTAAPTRPPPTQPPPNNAQTQTQTGFQLYPGSYGQVFTPYQQQPANNGQQQPMFMGQQQWTPPPLVETKYWMVSKMGLHGTSMVCCVVGMGLAFSLIGQDEDDFMGLDVLGITSGPILVFALVCDIVEVLTRALRKFKSGIHPGVQIALSLIIWIMTSIVGGMQATYSAIFNDDYSECSPSSTRYSRYDDEYESCKTQYGGIRPKIIAMTIFTCLVFMAHFILFVFACIDMSRRNRNNRAPVMVFAAPPYWGPAAQGFQQMPQNGGPPAQNQGQPIPMQNWAVPQMNEKGIAPMAPAQAPTDRYA